jgi:thioester reductase-like protein
MGAIRELAPALVAVTARCLRIAPYELDPTAPLARYGLDSLNALELSVALSEATGLEVPEDLFLDSPSLNDLAAQLGGATPTDEPADRLIDRMMSDALLPADIDPRGLARRLDGAIVLTGATGFLGAYMLRELLTSSERPIICPVRAGNDAHAADRLRTALLRYGLHVPDLGERVQAIAADITNPGLGLSAANYQRLADTVGAIYHCAADVNWARHYDALRVANVIATRELLRFACTRTSKRVIYVSSAAACLSSVSSAAITEQSAVVSPAGIHFGYGQSKWVAERLLEVAKRRGLDAAIVRPSLITVDTDSGVGNDDDVLARMIRGVIALGHAPDIGWRLDACPVQHVARAITGVGEGRGVLPKVLHLRHPQPVRWNELVLWLNLRGYSVAFEPFDRWIARVQRETTDPLHVLHPLRGFLLKQPLPNDTRFLPQLYADPHVASFDADSSDAVLASLGMKCPRIGTTAIGRMFDEWVRRDLIAEAVPRRIRRPMAVSMVDDAAIANAVRANHGDPGIVVHPSSHEELLAGQSILGELAAWHAGTDLRIHARRIRLPHPDGTYANVDIVIKPLLAAQAVLDVTAAVTGLAGKALANAFEKYRAYSELNDAARREIAIYGCNTGAIAACRPRSYGTVSSGPNTLLLIERITHAELIDAVEHVDAWTLKRTQAAIEGVARVHAEWLERESEVRRLLSETPQTGECASDAMASWCAALSDHAHPWLEATIGAHGAARQARLARRVCADLDLRARHPRTLIHHDFNPRNVALRTNASGVALCAYDWELACYGLPQRDVIEFLCFILPADVRPELFAEYLDWHRCRLQELSGQSFDARTWAAGAYLAAADFAVRRLPLYVLANRFKPMPYLSRVAKTWDRLFSMLEREAPEPAREAD